MAMSDEAQNPGDAAGKVSDKEKLDYDKVKTLFDYTKFHIGIYITLGGTLVAAIGTKVINFWVPILWGSIIALAVAGFAGGVIASSLPWCNSLREFEKTKTGPWGWEKTLAYGLTWTRIEHTAFWVAIGAALISLAVGKQGICGVD
jgi:hypothetical protein